jgi:hypothetical protein
MIFHKSELAFSFRCLLQAFPALTEDGSVATWRALHARIHSTAAGAWSETIGEALSANRGSQFSRPDEGRLSQRAPNCFLNIDLHQHIV